MLFNPRCHRKDIGVENYVLRRKSDADQQVISARADFHFAVLRIGLSGFIKRHNDYRCAICHAQPRMMQERVLALFHADRIDDGFARHAFQARFNHAPFAAVDHDRHAGNIGFGGDAFDELGHRLMRVEQPFIHVDVDDLRAVLHLLAGNLNGGFIIAGQDQFFELGAAGHIRALADIDEAGASICSRNLCF